MARNLDLDFDQLLVRTGAGSKCTACRLDLETIYLDRYDALVRAAPRKPVDGGAAKPTRARFSLRGVVRPILYALDRIAPYHPMALNDFSPVVAGKTLKQSVLVANDPLVTNPDKPCSAMSVSVTLRDAVGRTVMRDVRTLERAAAERWDLSTPLLDAAGHPSDGLVWGAVEVRRRWAKPALRGTTRPQLLIEGTGGNGSVHTQGPSGKQTHRYSVLVKPRHERIFIAVTNAGDRVLKAEVDFPKNAVDRSLSIPPFGVRGVEIDVEAAAAAQGQSAFALLSATCDGVSKTHILTASPTLDRMAIDHPAET